MNFTVSSGLLADRIRILARNIMPGDMFNKFNCIVFRLEDGMLTLSSWDTETLITTTVQFIEGNEDGSFALMTKQAADILLGLPEQPVTFTEKDGTVTISFMNGKYSLMSVDKSSVPEMPPVENDMDITLSAASIQRALNITVPFADKNAVNPNQATRPTPAQFSA